MPAASATEGSEGGRISGVVTSASTKAPLGGIQVCAELPEWDSSRQIDRACANTGSDGTYTIEGLPPGEGFPPGGYEVEFSSGLDYLPLFYDDKHERTQATLLPVANGSSFTGIDAEMEEGGYIGGTLTSVVTHDPIVGAQACASGFLLSYVCATTNAQGEYTIPRLMSGEYAVSFSASEGEVEFISQQYGGKQFPEEVKVAVTAPSKTSGIDAQLDAYGRIAGTVTDAQTGLPIEGVEVCMREDGSCESTNAAGDYRFAKLTAGEYALNFSAYRLNEKSATNYLSQLEGSEYLRQEDRKAMNPQANNVQVTMAGVATIDDQLEEGGQISGSMFDASTHEPASSWPCAEDLSSVDPELTKVCPVSMSGNQYTISELPPGEYRVAFGDGLPAYYYKQYYKDHDSESEAQAIQVLAGGDVTGIDADLISNPDPWEGAIGGTVTDVGGTGLEGVEVCAYINGSEGLYGECATTGADGEYLISGLGNGEYEVEFFPAPDEDYLTRYYGGEGEPAEAQPVTVVWGNITPGVDAQLQLGGRISGAAHDSRTGAPLEGILVCALAIKDEYPGCTITGPGGLYATPVLPGGEYDVGFADPHVYLTQYYNGVSSISQADPVKVTPGGSTPEVGALMQSIRTIPPVNTTQPVLSGEAFPAGTLWCAPGLWTGSNWNFAYRWLRDGWPIAGAEASTYEVPAGDAGAEIACEVTASNAGGDVLATSNSLTVSAKTNNMLAAPLVAAGALLEAPPPATAPPALTHASGGGSPADRGRPLIVGGNAVSIGSAPWQVTVQAVISKSEGLLCGGSIVDGSHILTAAHCVFDSKSGLPIPAEDFTVRAGTANLASSEAGEQRVGVTDVRPHPYYSYLPNSGKVNPDDVAVLTLEQPLVLGPRVATIPLLALGASLAEGTSASLTGFGQENAASEELNGRLYSLGMTVGYSRECGGENDAVILCASSVAGSPCNGDSGSGLTISAPGSVLAGVEDDYSLVSGERCADGALNSYANLAAPEIQDFVFGSETPPRAPRGGGAEIRGRITAGQSLSCAAGSWSGSPHIEYAFLDSQSGQVLQTGSSTTYALTAADVGRTILCEVRAVNEGGTGVGRTPPLPPILVAPVSGEAPPSTTLKVSSEEPVAIETPVSQEETPAPAAKTRCVSLAGSRVSVERSGWVLVELAHSGDGHCSGKLALTARGVDGSGGAKRVRTREIASGDFTIADVHTAAVEVKLKLNAYGHALFVRAHGSLGASLTIRQLAPSPTRVQRDDVRLAERVERG
ncbi:MAG TPA: carboxypeptidase regulatory-like domain-containing protein [Solirubrobacteraceae bacterium]|nr:carboxypeptidase regulatory-like domain-containing protein [Solirubrobacteraceae bacterium]